MKVVTPESGREIDHREATLNTTQTTDRSCTLTLEERRISAAEYLREAVVSSLIERGLNSYQVNAVHSARSFHRGFVENIGVIVTEPRARRLLGFPLPDATATIFEVSMSISSSPRNSGQSSGLYFSAGVEQELALCESISKTFSQLIDGAKLSAFSPRTGIH